MSCIGIISALSSEGRCLTGRAVSVKKPVQIDESAIVIVCGLGGENARIAAQMLIEQNVSALVSWGTAAALTEDIRAGDLILADSVITKGGDNYPFDATWNEYVANELFDSPLKIRHGVIAHTDQVLTTPESKKTLHSRTNALAVDMESITIARRAHAANLPCMAVRAIVDESSQVIPQAIIDNTDTFGRPALLPLLISLICKPDLIPALIHLAKGMKAARKTLKTVARSRAIFSGPV